ncbi:MAG: response regulator [Sedimentisphaerales bacterium]
MEKTRILVVDDEPDQLRILEKMLEARGHTVIIATCGSDAITLARTEHPDLIILDVALPDIPGGEVAATLKQYPQTSGIPIIFLSGMFSKTDESKKGHIVGGNTIFAKPCDLNELESSIEQLIRQRQVGWDDKSTVHRDRKKILIVDDDKDFVHILQLRLTASGYDVVFAMDGVSAIGVARQENPDVILVDIGLPAGDGFSVIERLAVIEKFVFTPIIVITGKDLSAVQQRATLAGAKAVLLKPVNEEKLLTTIRNSLEK